jgi:hypothetical protein
MEEVYCSSCSWEVFAIRENAELDEESKKKWDKLWLKIQRERNKRK